MRYLLTLSLAALLLTISFPRARAVEPIDGYHLVAQDDCGKAKEQPHLAVGGSWTWTDAEKQGLTLDDPRDADVAYHDSAVVFRFVGLRPEAKYKLRVFFFNATDARTETLSVDGRVLDGLVLPRGKAVLRAVDVPRETYRDAVISVVCAKVSGPNAVVSAIELWSDQDGLLGPEGSFIRFRVDALPPGQVKMQITASMKVHYSPWTTKAFSLTPDGITAPGFTPWLDLRKQPGGATGSLIFSVPAGAKGATQFGLVASDSAFIREFDWNEPDGTKLIVDPSLTDVRTFREQERRYYLNALNQTGRVYPLSRPPLLFSNAWGFATGPAAEYMVKTFRLLGFNSVSTGSDAAKYEQLYGWGSQGGQYSPPGYLPFDEAATKAKFTAYYRDFFGPKGRGADSAPGMVSF